MQYRIRFYYKSNRHEVYSAYAESEEAAGKLVTSLLQDPHINWAWMEDVQHPIVYLPELDELAEMLEF